MKTEFLDIPTTDGLCDSFLAHPGENGPYPGVILYMDGFGLRPYLYEMARTLASHGYCVLTPNLFYRIRRAPVMDVQFPVTPETHGEAVKQLMSLVQSFSPEAAVRDARTLMDFLAALPQVRPGRLGLTGYCMGGSLSLRVAAQYPDRIAAVASFHAGRLATDAPNSPHLLVGSIRAEIYLGHADNDAGLPPEQIERLRQALDQAGARYEAEVYRGAAHGFTMADLPAYNEAALKKHWDKLLALFKRNLS